MAPSYSYFSFQENFDHTTTDIRITLSFNILQVWSIPKNREIRPPFDHRSTTDQQSLCFHFDIANTFAKRLKTPLATLKNTFVEH